MTPRTLTRLLGVVSLLTGGALIWLMSSQLLHRSGTVLVVLPAILASLTTIFGMVLLVAPLWPSPPKRRLPRVHDDQAPPA